MIGEAASQVVGAETFVGHAGGDDFVVVVPPEHATTTAQQIVQMFDEMVPVSTTWTTARTATSRSRIGVAISSGSPC